MSGPYRGSCLCAAIQFEVDEFAPQTGNCHCSMCRKFHGAAYATIAEAKQQHFRWLCGEDSLKAYTADNGTTRRFCEHCGSSLTFSSPAADPELVEISLGCFDDEVASAADWNRLRRRQSHSESNQLFRFLYFSSFSTN